MASPCERNVSCVFFSFFSTFKFISSIYRFEMEANTRTLMRTMKANAQVNVIFFFPINVRRRGSVAHQWAPQQNRIIKCNVGSLLVASIETKVKSNWAVVVRKIASSIFSNDKCCIVSGRALSAFMLMHARIPCSCHNVFHIFCSIRFDTNTWNALFHSNTFKFKIHNNYLYSISLSSNECACIMHIGRQQAPKWMPIIHNESDKMAQNVRGECRKMGIKTNYCLHFINFTLHHQHDSW